MADQAPSRTVRVTLAEAPTDVLVWLAAQRTDVWWTVNGIAGQAAPAEAIAPMSSTADAVRLLLDAGYVEGMTTDGFPGFRATDAGRAAVAEATANISRQTP